MADQTTLTANVRTEFGKGAARRTRRAGLIPAVLYGHGEQPRHLALPSHQTFLIVKDHANAVITLDIEGDQQTALVKDIQRDPVKRTIEHLDLLIIRKGERVSVEIPVHVEGESAPGTIHQVESQTLLLNVSAVSIPDYINVSIEGLEDGAVLRVSDLTAPKGAEFETDPETAVIVVSTPRAEEEDEDAEDAEETEAAEGGEESTEE
ncbi:50S ribosomal protein L25/general stress protein Ctc [Bogoriella caseilytica]|uniref:Large ribosomal subunit protein bL25 n=1 Tax=Bogoriella caseilytica TaxID=56055 RepID=A0A3N2BAM2_9MICO|nr:50S ribosomal protein L25/general stress protein Ctc [Bogoriella caseilytica]ROR72238.1 large subunit ribosomal protein L25 [Bogoriella caseilytica]